METTEKISANAYEAGRNMGRKVDETSSSAHEVIDDVTKAARPAMDRVATSAHRAVDKLATVAGQAADSFGVKSDQFMKMQDQAVEQVRGYVRENPVASIGIALAAGYLLSKLLSSR